MLSGCRTRLFSAGNLLLISQFAVSTVMVLVAGAFVAHFFRISATDTGISRTSVGTVELMLGVTRPDAAEIRQLLEDLRRRAGESQGLHGLTFATNLPSGIRGGIAITPEGRPTFSQTGGSATIGAGLFETLGIPLIQGRDFHDLDRPGAPQVAIVSASAAATWFPGQAPLGRRFNVNGMQGWFEIVGVVGNTQVDLVRGGEKMFYLPLSQNPRWDLMVLASAPGGSVAATQAIRRLILDVDSNLAVGPAKSVGQLLEESIFTQWLFASGFGSLAALALFLAALGLHGSMAYLVSRQTRELGLRIALGATAVDLQRMVVWQGMRVVAIGTAVGLYAAVLAIESIQKMTVEPVTSIGLGAFALGPTVLAVAALSACYLPARRASQVDPVVALRAL